MVNSCSLVAIELHIRGTNAFIHAKKIHLPLITRAREISTLGFGISALRGYDDTSGSSPTNPMSTHQVTDTFTHCLLQLEVSQKLWWGNVDAFAPDDCSSVPELHLGTYSPGSRMRDEVAHQWWC